MAIIIVPEDSALRVHPYGCGTRSQTTVQTAIGRLRRLEECRDKKERKTPASRRISHVSAPRTRRWRSFNLEVIVRRPRRRDSRDPSIAREQAEEARGNYFICECSHIEWQYLGTWKLCLSCEYTYIFQPFGFLNWFETKKIILDRLAYSRYVWISIGRVTYTE